MACCGGNKSCGPAKANGEQPSAPVPKDGANPQDIKESVSQYYKSLQNSNQLKTSACTTCKAPPPEVRELLKRLPQEIVEKCVHTCLACLVAAAPIKHILAHRCS